MMSKFYLIPFERFEWVHHEESKDNNTERIVLNMKLCKLIFGFSNLDHHV
jgi:hypothetical protein